MSNILLAIEKLAKQVEFPLTNLYTVDGNYIIFSFLFR